MRHSKKVNISLCFIFFFRLKFSSSFAAEVFECVLNMEKWDYQGKSTSTIWCFGALFSFGDFISCNEILVFDTAYGVNVLYWLSRIASAQKSETV